MQIYKLFEDELDEQLDEQLDAQIIIHLHNQGSKQIGYIP
jgi:hypothetical protein